MICDLNVPSCDKCSKIGRRCDYGKVRLRWTDCVASRGRLAGKKIPLYQSKSQMSQTSQLAQASQIVAAPVLKKNADYHMLYFEKELLPRFNISNTMPHLDLKDLYKDPILVQSVIAVANAHATYRSANEQSLTLSKIQDRNKALKLFREHLMGAHTNETSSSLFIANVLLCILDGILEPLTESTAVSAHLVGGKAILKQWTNMKDIIHLKYELPVLMLSIFATMDLTHAMLIGDDPYFDAASWAEFGNCEAWWGNVQADDDFLEIMAILSQLSTLGHEVCNFRSTAPIGILLAIQTALEKTDNKSSEKASPKDLAWNAFCATYRYAASVYLFRALSALEVDHALVQNAVTLCIEVVAGSDLTDKLHHCILFPLLIVGTHCLVEEQRVHIRKSIARTSSYLSFEALRSLEAFLEKRWSQLDKSSDLLQSNWWTYYEEIANVTCLF